MIRLLLESSAAIAQSVIDLTFIALVSKSMLQCSSRNPSILKLITGVSASVSGLGYLVVIAFLQKSLILFAGVEGFSWLMLSGSLIFKSPRLFLRIWYSVMFAMAFSRFVLAITAIRDAEGTEVFKLALDIASWPISCSFLALEFFFQDKEDGQPLREPLLDPPRISCSITQAGWISRHYFLWLKPLLSLGSRKSLQESDMPPVSPVDQAASAHARFISSWSTQSSLLRALCLSYWRDSLPNGVYALLKCITVTAGPLILKSFVYATASGSSSLGFILVLVLFLGKLLESIGQRQWIFGSKRLGMRMRSGIMAALFHKQMKISSLSGKILSAGEVMSFMAVDAYRVGEFGYWIHVLWSTPLQIVIAGGILIHSVGLAPASAGLAVITLSMLANRPLASMQRRFHNGFMAAQDRRMRATTAILRNMKIVKVQAWEEMFRRRIMELREEEMVWLSKVQYRKTYNAFLFWLLPVLVSTSTFVVCWLTGSELDAGSVFTTLATFRIIQEPIRLVPEMIAAVVQFRVSLARISGFLRAEELVFGSVVRKEGVADGIAVCMREASLSWDLEELRKHGGAPTLRDINLSVKSGSRVAVCGEVGSGKSTLLLSILGEVPKLQGTIEVAGTVAYVAQAAWIQSGTIRDNVLFGTRMDEHRYAQVLTACALDKDLECFPFGDLTEIGERGLNLSGGQKQRIQLARALYQDADVYLLDDPFSAVDAQTGSLLFQSCILGVLSNKTVILVTHQVEFLQSFDSILLMLNGAVHSSGTYNELLDEVSAFQSLVMAHKEVMSTLNGTVDMKAPEERLSKAAEKDDGAVQFNQLTKQEKKEHGDTGMKPYMDYLTQANGIHYFGFSIVAYLVFVSGQMASNWWMAAKVENEAISTAKLIGVYSAIGLTTGSCLFMRSVLVVMMGLKASKSFFSGIIDALFAAPMSFFDSTPSGRILSRLSVDMSIIDLDIAMSFAFSVSAFISALANLGMTSSVTWQILFIVVPMMYFNRLLQVYYLSSARELMRINGTTKGPILSSFGESISGVITIRAFNKQQQVMETALQLIDTNSSPFFHNFAAREWLIQRLEMIWSSVLCLTALIMVLLPPGSIAPGFVGLVLSYGLSLNISQIASVQNQCNLANMIISVERIKQYMALPGEPLIKKTCLPKCWPDQGKVELVNLQIRYSPDAPLVLRGITCTILGGQKVGVVGRTGSGKTTLISALFRLVDPADGRILIDSVDIMTVGLTDLRSRLSIIPQEPTLFRGTVRFNVDPLSEYTDAEIWEALKKCQLAESVKEKPLQLDSFVGEDGENWSVGERQLFCLGRALLKSSKILVLDEATASIDNATDAILQKLLRSEFGKCTTITVAHRIPTVISSDMVLALENGCLTEFDSPARLLEQNSLFSKLVAEYWSNSYHLTP